MSGLIGPSLEQSPVVDGSDRFDRTGLTWPKRIIIALAPLALYAAFFFHFLIDSNMLGLCLLATSALLAIPLAVFLLQALLRRHWKLVSIYAFVLVLLCVPFTETVGPHVWLRSLGFYVRTQSFGDYRSACRLTDFIEDGVKQTAGACEAFDGGEQYELIIYDTTGEWMRPPPQRSPEWTHVMEGATMIATLPKERRAYRVFGNYYCLAISRYDFDD